MLDFGYYNMDCIEGMKQFPDKYFDLAIVDPPYGNGSEDYDARTQRYGGVFDKYFQDNKEKVKRTGGTLASKYEKNINEWDVAPPEEYFTELFRVSKNQIIWGGITLNYRKQGVLLFGRNLVLVKIFQWQWQNMLGPRLMIMLRFLNVRHRAIKNPNASILHRNQLRCMNGF